jgi:hypothetical protein
MTNLISIDMLNLFKIKLSEPCYCGSKAPIQECCFLTPHSSWLTDEDLEKTKNILWKSWKLPIGERNRIIEKINNTDKLCLSCSEVGIWSHTISQSRIRKYFPNWECSTPINNENNEKEQILKKTWIREASWFIGWCSTHDSELFSEIDNNWVSPSWQTFIVWIY